MQLFRQRKWRPYPVAIMLIATLAVVWHGAMSLLAHPLAANSYALAMTSAVHGNHAHFHARGVDDDHLSHGHGKSKAGSDCCSTVGAATLTGLTATEVTIELLGRVTPTVVLLGESLPPATLAEPPRTNYQS